MSKSNSLKPLFDYILVKPTKQEEVTSSGIVLPDTAEKKTQMGEVQEVGPDAKAVKKGQTIVYKEWGPQKIKLGQVEWLLIKEEDAMAIVG